MYEGARPGREEDDLGAQPSVPPRLATSALKPAKADDRLEQLAIGEHRAATRTSEHFSAEREEALHNALRDAVALLPERERTEPSSASVWTSGLSTAVNRVR